MSKKGDECCNKWFYMEDRKGSINKAKEYIMILWSLLTSYWIAKK